MNSGGAYVGYKKYIFIFYNGNIKDAYREEINKNIYENYSTWHKIK